MAAVRWTSSSACDSSTAELHIRGGPVAKATISRSRNIFTWATRLKRMHDTALRKYADLFQKQNADLSQTHSHFCETLRPAFCQTPLQEGNRGIRALTSPRFALRALLQRPAIFPPASSRTDLSD